MSGQDRLAADQIEIMISEGLRVSQLQQSDLQSLESLQSQIPINKLASCSLLVLVQKYFISLEGAGGARVAHAKLHA